MTDDLFQLVYATDGKPWEMTRNDALGLQYLNPPEFDRHIHRVGWRISAAREAELRGETVDVVRNPFEQALHQAFVDAEELMLRKHHDYGPGNISQAPGGPMNGLRVRLWDKLARLNHLIDRGVDPKNETVLDTLRDIANYGIIGVMVQEGTWPK